MYIRFCRVHFLIYPKVFSCCSSLKKLPFKNFGRNCGKMHFIITWSVISLCPLMSVCLLVGMVVGWLAYYLKGRKVTLPCSYLSTCCYFMLHKLSNPPLSQTIEKCLWYLPIPISINTRNLYSGLIETGSLIDILLLL